MVQATYPGPGDDPSDLGFVNNIRRRNEQRMRTAGDLPAEVAQEVAKAKLLEGIELPEWLKRANTWSSRKLAVGGGGLALAGLMGALGELNNPDPMVTAEQRVGGAIGAGGGGVLGGAAGGALAGMMTGGPIGALVLGSLGAALGSAGGGALGRNLVGAFGPSAEDKARAAYLKDASAQADAELLRMQKLMPIQQDIAQLAIANEAQRMAVLNPLEAQRQRNAAMAQGLLNAQSAAASQAQMATQQLYGRGIV